MPYLERIAAANRRDLTGFLPFAVAGVPVGRVRASFAERLAEFVSVFRLSRGALRLVPDLDHDQSSPGERTGAVAEVLEVLRGQGVIRGWRDERYPVSAGWGKPALMTLERAAVPRFGVTGYGVHLNGLVRRPDGLHLWVARRSRAKLTDPGKLDQLVAGGQPAELSLRENLHKECAEEAGIVPGLAAAARPAGTVSYALCTAEGFRPDVLFVFDLELPVDFRPRNTDGEVESFSLWPIREVAQRVRETSDFKFNCALVVIDFLLRHGQIDPEEPGYAELVAGLRGREPFLEAESRRGIGPR